MAPPSPLISHLRSHPPHKTFLLPIQCILSFSTPPWSIKTVNPLSSSGLGTGGRRSLSTGQLCVDLPLSPVFFFLPTSPSSLLLNTPSPHHLPSYIHPLQDFYSMHVEARWPSISDIHQHTPTRERIERNGRPERTFFHTPSTLYLSILAHQFVPFAVDSLSAVLWRCSICLDEN